MKPNATFTTAAVAAHAAAEEIPAIAITPPPPAQTFAPQSGQPIRTPRALSPEEQVTGLARIMAEHFARTLQKTCVLNSGACTKLRATWQITYAKEDFGREQAGTICGGTGDPLPTDDVLTGVVAGELAAMPPDQFRKASAQEIPSATLVKPAQDGGPPQIFRVKGGSQPRGGKDRT